MKKTGFKTFVCSFVFTLSAIIGIDRAFFYTPHSTEEDVYIPRKNIALFFQKNHSQTYSSPVEPVYSSALETPDFENEKSKIAQKVPMVDSETLMLDSPQLSENEEIPLVVEEIPPKLVAENKSLIDAPLVYAGNESLNPADEGKLEQVVLAAEPAEEEIEDSSAIQLAEMSKEESYPSLNEGIFDPEEQFMEIDNAQQDKRQLLAKEDSLLAENIKAKEVNEKTENVLIPLQSNALQMAELEEPEQTQVASLGGEVTLTEAEDIVDEEVQENREWQTMAEKHETESPWVVARGSKFVKNKQVLKENFSSETAQKEGERLMSAKKTNKPKTTKVAVQDNLLIPIPQELLDEDNLVPDLGNDEDKKSLKEEKEKEKPQEETKKKDGSFIDSIASVFSKENREKAIKKLKAKSSKILKESEDVRPQILPTEIRLSFQPNRAEISGQTLRWIQAFAKKAVEEEDVGLEIRIDGSKSFALQQKRLNMLYNILTANGVEYQKINTAFVDREPNSFVVRTVKIMNASMKEQEGDSWKKYYQKW